MLKCYDKCMDANNTLKKSVRCISFKTSFTTRTSYLTTQNKQLRQLHIRVSYIQHEQVMLGMTQPLCVQISILVHYHKKSKNLSDDKHKEAGPISLQYVIHISQEQIRQKCLFLPLPTKRKCKRKCLLDASLYWNFVNVQYFVHPVLFFGMAQQYMKLTQNLHIFFMNVLIAISPSPNIPNQQFIMHSSSTKHIRSR
eukprot:TRINITY_DN4287_c0_g1_i5.p2 TRINITY_DN4287_c0_g1~~TRINITY_DN4287_c0_g1_i5.p2  ORF type:complete len:197 (+),score=-8.87 TRINITY_DN4287_c0_g1_i5:700-1290(+)